MVECYVLTYTKSTPNKNKISKIKDYLIMLMQCFCMFFFFLLIFFIKAYVAGTHLYCIDAIQMGTHNISFYKKVDKR